MSKRILIAMSCVLAFLVILGCERSRTKSQVSEATQNRIKRAKQLLKEAGYEDPEDFPEVSLLYNTDKLHEKVAVAVQDMWKQNLGINVQLTNTEWKTYLDKLNNQDYEIARRGWIGDYNDPYTFLEMFRTNGGNNDTGWGRKRYDQLLDQSEQAKTKQKRYEILSEAERILMKGVPIVPMYFYVTQELVKPHVEGWYQTIRAVHTLRTAYRTDGKPLVIHLGDGIQSLDPAKVEGVMGHRVQNGLFEGLTRYDPKTLEPQPGVAKSWDISDDRTKYTFHLREDAKWSDGEPVTAHNFEFAWKRILDPATGSQYAHILYFLKGAEKFHSGEVDNPDVVQVKATDDHTLKVELEHPTPQFLKLLSFATYYPLREDLIKKYGRQWTRPKHFEGNGAFVLKERVVNNHITLKKNEKFREAEQVKQDIIEFRVVKKTSTAYNLYQKGEIDIMTTIPAENREEVLQRDDFHSGPYLGTYYYAFNTEKEPFDDPKVRRALGLAINRKRIVEKITKAGEQPAYHFVPPHFEGFDHTRFDRIRASE